MKKFTHNNHIYEVTAKHEFSPVERGLVMAVNATSETADNTFAAVFDQKHEIDECIETFIEKINGQTYEEVPE